jgi:hypothetical protein
VIRPRAESRGPLNARSTIDVLRIEFVNVSAGTGVRVFRSFPRKSSPHRVLLNTTQSLPAMSSFHGTGVEACLPEMSAATPYCIRIPCIICMRPP